MKALLLLILFASASFAQTPRVFPLREVGTLIADVLRPLVRPELRRCRSGVGEPLPFYYPGDAAFTLAADLRRCLTILPKDSFPNRNPYQDGYQGRILVLNRVELQDSSARVWASYFIIRGQYRDDLNYARGVAVEFRKRDGRWVEIDRIEGVTQSPQPFIQTRVAQLPAFSVSPADCKPASSAPTLDHVVLVVQNLDRAAAPFKQHGFRLKPGRLHANNLINRHIKFRDGSSIELMTLQGKPTDAMARRYADLLARGEGGVYVAFNIANIATTQELAASLRLQSQRSSSGRWNFLGFPDTSPAAAVFFSEAQNRVRDVDSLVSHRLPVTGLAEVWLEGGRELGELLVTLGAKRCGSASFAGRTGQRLALNGGAVVVVPQRHGARARVLGAVLRSEDNRNNVIRPHSQFWLSY